MKGVKISFIVYAVSIYLTIAFFAIAVYGIPTGSGQTSSAVGTALCWTGIAFQSIAATVAFIFALIGACSTKKWESRKMLLFVSTIKSVLVPYYLFNFLAIFGLALAGFYTGFAWIMIPFVWISSAYAMLVTSIASSKSIYQQYADNEIGIAQMIGFLVTQWIFLIDMPCSWVAFALAKKPNDRIIDA